MILIIKSNRTKLDVKRSETYSVVMTNERSFSVVNASAPVGTTDKLSDFYLTCLVFHQFPAAHLKMLVITSQSVR